MGWRAGNGIYGLRWAFLFGTNSAKGKQWLEAGYEEITGKRIALYGFFVSWKKNLYHYWESHQRSKVALSTPVSFRSSLSVFCLYVLCYFFLRGGRGHNRTGSWATAEGNFLFWSSGLSTQGRLFSLPRDEDGHEA